MQKYAICLAAAAALITLSARAQEDEVQPKKKTPETIVIRDKNVQADKKTVIVIENGKVTVNGQPASDWNDGKVTIRRDDMDGDFLVRPDARMSLDMPRADFQLKSLKLLTDAYGAGQKVRLGVFSEDNEKGAEVTKVVDSSAAFKAGLKQGDIITKVNNSPISGPESLSKAIRDREPKDVVTIYFIRDNQEQSTKVTLEGVKQVQINDLVLRPDMQFNIDHFRGLSRHPRLGAHIQDTEDSAGVKVLQVDPESPAAKAGLQKDDIITAIDGKKVAGTDDALDVLQDGQEKFNYSVTVTRGGSALTLQVKIPHELRSANL
jgi:serine protease Do